MVFAPCIIKPIPSLILTFSLEGRRGLVGGS
jgi:hypothetical protein